MDVFLFYVLFEATLIPIYFLIGGFGGPRRSYAAVKFLLFSLFGGLLMLASVVGLYVVSARLARRGRRTCSRSWRRISMDQDVGRWLFLGFFVAFAIKAPMLPVHTWLPDAGAGGARPGTSVLLVSILDKIGTFGMIRFCLELFPEASKWATPVVLVLAVVSVLYGALAAIGQRIDPPPDRLHVGIPLRLHRDGHLRAQQLRPDRVDALHVQPRPLDRRPVPGDRLPDQPARLAARSATSAGWRRSHRCWPALSWWRGSPRCRCPGSRRSSRSSSCWSARSPTTRGTPSFAVARHRAGRALHPADVPAHHDRRRRARDRGHART